jgi:AraC-like DNA-binding protein
MDKFYIIRSFNDFDDFAESVTWDLEFMQIDGGKFRADLIFFGDKDLQIAETRYNQKLLQNGSVPAGYTFAINHPDSTQIIWRYLDFPPNGIIVFPEDKEHYGISEANHHPFTLTFSESFLITTSNVLGLPNLHRFIKKGAVQLCDPVYIRQLQSILRYLCARIKYTEGRFINTLINSDKKGEIARLLLNALASSKIMKTKKRQLYRRSIVISRILNYVDSDMATPPSIPELCRIGGVDERTLRNIFYERFSLSPKKYINYYRLNTLRSIIKKTDFSEMIISDIANKYGFWHMGQLARDYKNLFGELPSETRQKFS